MDLLAVATPTGAKKRRAPVGQETPTMACVETIYSFRQLAAALSCPGKKGKPHEVHVGTKARLLLHIFAFGCVFRIIAGIGTHMFNGWPFWL